MEQFHSYLIPLSTLIVVHIFAAMSPGPSFVFASHTAANGTRKEGLQVALGMGVGAFLWAVAAIAGLGFFFEKVPLAFTVFKVVGALFILWVAFQIFQSTRNFSSTTVEEKTKPGNIFWQALRLQLSNPKVVVFYGSIFLELVPPHSPMWFKELALLIILIDETLWYVIVALVISLPQNQKIFMRWKNTINRIMAALLLILGIKMLIA